MPQPKKGTMKNTKANEEMWFRRRSGLEIGAAENFGHDDGVADGGGGAEHAEDLRQGEFRGGFVGLQDGRFGGAGFQLAQLVIEDLVEVGLHLFVGQIDLRAKPPRVFGDLLRAAEVFIDEATDTVRPVGEFRIDDFDLLQGFGDRSRGWCWSLTLGLLGRLLGWPLLRFLDAFLLLTFGLRFGLGPHLGDAAEKFFDFVFHGGCAGGRGSRQWAVAGCGD